jgi:hypothetical protein
MCGMHMYAYNLFGQEILRHMSEHHWIRTSQRQDLCLSLLLYLILTMGNSVVNIKSDGLPSQKMGF